MFRNYLKIAWRSLSKHRLVTAINVGGLALAVTCCLLIGLWVLDELSYDRFLPNINRVYRLESTTRTPDGSQMNLPAVGWPVGKILQADYPEVERLTYVKSWTPQLKHRGVYVQEHALMADEHFMAVLGYELAQGNSQTALREPFSVILSPETEEKYFGRGNGMGKILMVSDTLPYRVTGVFHSVPRNGHLQFTMVCSLASLHTLYPKDMEYEYASGWFDLNVANYVLLRPGMNAGAFATKISKLVGQRGRDMVKQTGMNSTLRLRPLPDVYLHSNMPTENGSVGNARSLYLFGAIGLFVLLIAGLNVVNLSTAQATQRTKEVSIKKALGGLRSQLVSQFMVEAGVVCGIATLLGLAGAGLLLPLVQTFTGKLLTYTNLFSFATFGLVLGFLALLIPLTSLYPAYMLAGFQPVAGPFQGPATGKLAQSVGGVLLRKALVVAQFVVSVGLIVCTLVAWQQVKFMGRQPLGFDQQNVVVVDLKAVSGQVRNKLAQTLRSELLTHSQIPLATACNAVPGQTGWNGQFAHSEGSATGKGILVEHIPVDASYAQTLRLPLLAGRYFTLNSKADENQSFLINEMAMNAFGWNVPANAIGKRLSVSGINGKVVGVLRNYHQHSLQATIRPVVLNIMPVATTVAFRYEGSNTGAVISHLEATWERVAAGYPLTYTFLDDAFQHQYVAEQRLIQAFSVAAVLAILIACLGLFGLAAFMAEQRTKEIGVRKVLGASVFSIVGLLSQDFLKLVLIAILIASPIAWYAMSRWLQDFAYRIDIEWWVFALAGLLAVGIALLTVSFQSVKAALMNPVKSLRTE